jgi:hypothetical protein
MPTTAETVDTMLAAAGLDPSPAERQEMVTMYEAFKPGVEALYAVPEARYEDPALVFLAQPPLDVW